MVACNYRNLYSELVKVKQVTPLQETKGVIYKLNCNDCEANYIGQSGQRIATRMYRHRLAEKNCDKEHYPLIAHCQAQKHTIDWRNVQILDIDTHAVKRILKESFFINASENSVNIQENAYFSDIYEFIFNQIRLPAAKRTITVPSIVRS